MLAMIRRDVKRPNVAETSAKRAQSVDVADCTLSRCLQARALGSAASLVSGVCAERRPVREGLFAAVTCSPRDAERRASGRSRRPGHGAVC